MPIQHGKKGEQPLSCSRVVLAALTAHTHTHTRATPRNIFNYTWDVFAINLLVFWYTTVGFVTLITSYVCADKLIVYVCVSFCSELNLIQTKKKYSEMNVFISQQVLHLSIM